MTEHYYTERPKSELKTEKTDLDVDGRKLEFITPSGVFSYGKLDKASLLLLENCEVESGWSILDVGCGWGLIGIVLKKVYPDCSVTMTDINKRAVRFAKNNAKQNDVEVEVLQGELYEAIGDRKFDTVISNPPMKAGRDVCYELIKKAKGHLKKDGLLQIVAYHNKGGQALMEKMKEVFGNVDTVAKSGGFRVYISQNSR